jgi:hypothetical protein
MGGVLSLAVPLAAVIIYLLIWYRAPTIPVTSYAVFVGDHLMARWPVSCNGWVTCCEGR